MPEKRTIKKAQKAKRQGKSPSTQAGAFVQEAIEHIRKGKHGAKNTKQAIAIGLSEARRSGVAIPDPAVKKSRTKKTGAKTSASKKSTTRSTSGRIALKKAAPKRSKAALNRLKDEPTSTVSHAALSRHAKKVAKSRSKTDLHASAMKAAKTRAKHAR